MPEIHQPLIPLKIDYVCDSCGIGNLSRPNAKLEAIPSTGGGLLHRCPVCEVEYRLPQSYPYMTYVNFFEFVQDAKAAVASAKERNRG